MLGAFSDLFKFFVRHYLFLCQPDYESKCLSFQIIFQKLHVSDIIAVYLFIIVYNPLLEISTK